jgi:hypothetical protein
VIRKRALSDEEITASTGARVASESHGGEHGAHYEVQLEGTWIEVDHHSYERVRAIQDSCA